MSDFHSSVMILQTNDWPVSWRVLIDGGGGNDAAQYSS